MGKGAYKLNLGIFCQL